MASDPRLGARIGAVAELVDLRLVEFHCDFVAEREPQLPLNANVNVAIESFQSEGLIGYVTEYQVLIEEEDGGHEIERIEITYRLVFTVPEGFEPSETEREAYGENTVRLMIHPYMRELVHSTTMKTGIPPLLLGVARSAAVDFEVQPAGGSEGEPSAAD